MEEDMVEWGAHLPSDNSGQTAKNKLTCLSLLLLLTTAAGHFGKAKLAQSRVGLKMMCGSAT